MCYTVPEYQRAQARPHNVLHFPVVNQELNRFPAFQAESELRM